MNEKPSRRPRFTLRTLLVVVAVCAAGIWFWTVELPKVFRLKPGMNIDTVDQILGSPKWESEIIGPGAQTKRGYRGWVVIFVNGKCTDYMRDETYP